MDRLQKFTTGAWCFALVLVLSCVSFDFNKKGRSIVNEAKDFRMMPIVREINPHTGKLDGDDDGYRDVVVSPFDRSNPDPLVVIDGQVAYYPILHAPARRDICMYYEQGLGGSKTLLLRAPALSALVDADRSLERYGRRLFVIDAWRGVETQAENWKRVFLRVRGDQNSEPMTLSDVVSTGLEANKVASYAAVKKTPEFEAAVADLLVSANARAEIEAAARKFVMSEEAVVRLYYTFMTALGMAAFDLDDTANTAHGGGGAVDSYLLDTTSGLPTCLGVPYDYPGSSAVIDYFEHDENFEKFVAEMSARSDLRAYIKVFFPDEFTIKEFHAIRDERRMLFHAMRSVGATYFSLGADEGEPWHFNLGNELGGKQAELYPGAGNGCHAVLKNIRDPETGERIAVWGNFMGHLLAREFGE